MILKGSWANVSETLLAPALSLFPHRFCYKMTLNRFQCSSSTFSLPHTHNHYPIPCFISPLTVITVFWLLSRCHAETTTMAPLCHSTMLPRECLFNSGMLWQWKHHILSKLNPFIDSLLPARHSPAQGYRSCLHFSDWWHSLSTCLAELRQSLPWFLKSYWMLARLPC